MNHFTGGLSIVIERPHGIGCRDALHLQTKEPAHARSYILHSISFLRAYGYVWKHSYHAGPFKQHAVYLKIGGAVSGTATTEECSNSSVLRSSGDAFARHSTCSAAIVDASAGTARLLPWKESYMAVLAKVSHIPFRLSSTSASPCGTGLASPQESTL